MLHASGKMFRRQVEHLLIETDWTALQTGLAKLPIIVLAFRNLLFRFSKKSTDRKCGVEVRKLD